MDWLVKVVERSNGVPTLGLSDDWFWILSVGSTLTIVVVGFPVADLESFAVEWDSYGGGREGVINRFSGCSFVV